MRLKAILRRWRTARVSLAISVLFAAIVFGYGLVSDRPVVGTVMALVVLAAGVWEVYRNHASLGRAERLERDAEDQRESRRR